MTRISFVLGMLAVCTGVACSRPGIAAPAPDPPILDPQLSWYGNNRQRLEQFISTHGTGSPGHDAEHPPVAVFDWDNTVIKNDIGDAYLAHLLRNDKVRAPAVGDWGTVCRWLTPVAREALARACGEHPAGQPMLTSTDADCTDELFSVYEEAKTTTGQPAFSVDGYNHRWIKPQIALLAQLQAGYTVDELTAFARSAIDEALAADLGSTQQVGNRHEMPAWIRVYPQSLDLVGALQRHGFDVWVVSASPEPAVLAFAGQVGVDSDHVIGIRSVADGTGRLTHGLQGCGPVQAGHDGVMTYMEGKRCWINRGIFGDLSEAAMEPSTEHRPVFVAGDADTDVSMLRDATGLRLVINRGRSEVMCRAYHDEDGRWLVNPMFIEPLPGATAPFPCSSSACVDSNGVAGPCLDEQGAIIPDQTDRAFGGR